MQSLGVSVTAPPLRRRRFPPAALLDLDFRQDRYSLNGAAQDFGSLLAYSGSGPATMQTAAGDLVWSAHNLVTGSEAPATQTVTVTAGAAYTVEITGSGSVILSDAATGTVTEGSPAVITAASTALTLTVSGTVTRMWAYRSDLSGMADNPDNSLGAGFASYVPTAAAPVYKPRRNAYANGLPAGLLLESEARTNLLLNSAALATQSVTVTAEPHTLHFTGTGTVTLSGAATAGPLTGTGADDRVSLSFIPAAGSLTLTVSGSVTLAQLEAGSTPSSYIPTAGAAETRAAETLSVPAALLPAVMPAAVSLALAGTMTYADENATAAVDFYTWLEGGANSIRVLLDTDGDETGSLRIRQEASNVLDSATSADDAYAPGTAVPFSIASRHGAAFVTGAHDGTLLAAIGTPSALPDLVNEDISIGQAFTGSLARFRMWDRDLGNSGIARVTA